MTLEEFLKVIAEISKYLAGGAFGGVLGYLLKAQIDHRLAIARIYKTAKVTEFNKAVASVRAAFAPSLAFIYLAKKHGSTHEVPDVDAFLKKSLPELAAAIEIFRPFIPKSGRTAYQQAWEKYRYEVWNYGFDATTFREDVDDPYKIFEDLIHNVLQYAEPEKEDNT
jgi:hypothetical protein